jgi:hypothetical protein
LEQKKSSWNVANCFIYISFASSYMTRYKILAMGFPTKVQLIKRAKSEQWYINLPSAIAQAMEFERGETVEWLIEDKQKMVLKRDESVLDTEKKNFLRSLN